MHSAVDHLLYGSPELELGVAEIERLTGVRPRLGGRHPGLGTHNALLSLGGRTYLEVIAPDPTQDDVAGPPPYGIASLREPALRAWAVAPEDIEWAVREGRAAGIDYGEITAHSRLTPDGEEVRWRMATRTTPEQGAAVLPFLIDWGTTAHPAQHSPGGVRLVELRVLAPEPEEVRRQLRAIGAEVTVLAAARPGLEVVLVGPSEHEVLLGS